MTTSIRSIFNKYQQQLQTVYSVEEAKEIFYRLVEHFLKISRAQLLLVLNQDAEAELSDKLRISIERLLQNEPLQYVIGEVEFYDCILKVNPSVLIPRPETEELVDMISKEWKGMSPQIIDFGTGSGCIPIALAHALPLSTVKSVDISADALSVARENARLNGVEVAFEQADMRSYQSDAKYDVIVSNPPYVMSSEKLLMRDNVLVHEPHLALFVDDSTPLEFYIPIAEFASQSLADRGKVYMEINQQLGAQTAELFIAKGMVAEVKQDFFGVDRFVVARWM